MQRSNQRVVRSTEFCTYFLSAFAGAHSSNAIAIVDPRFDCICMLSSGPMNILCPSICVPISLRSAVETAPFIAATVPTFINTGVCITPCTVCISALLARPSVFNNLYIFILPIFYKISQYYLCVMSYFQKSNLQVQVLP